MLALKQGIDDTNVPTSKVSDLPRSSWCLPVLTWFLFGQTLFICWLYLWFPRETMFKKAKTRAKKKPRKRSDSSGGYNLSDVLQSPPSAGQCVLASFWSVWRPRGQLRGVISFLQHHVGLDIKFRSSRLVARALTCCCIYQTYFENLYLLKL